LVCATLNGLGIDVIDLGLSTTPTVEMAVVMEQANGGIILTASHNPKQWNALKLLNSKGEFISDELGKQMLAIAESGNIEFADVDKLGKITEKKDYIAKHIDEILKLIVEDSDKIICGSLFFRPVGMHPFHISDHILAGKLYNIKLMFNSAYENLINNFWNFPIPECQLGIAYLMNKDDEIKLNVKDINVYDSPAPTKLDTFNDDMARELIQNELRILNLFGDRIYNELTNTNKNWKNIKKWTKLIEYSIFHINNNLKKSEYPKIDELSILRKHFKIIDVALLKPYLCTCTVNHFGERAWYESEISHFDKEHCITTL
jgi:hypothetical protein